MTALADFGIELKNPSRPGKHRAPCPWCARAAKDDPLAVKVDLDGGATWFCHRCETTGGIGPERPPQKPKERAPKPERHETLAPWAVDFWGECKPIAPGTPAARYLEARHCALPPWTANSDLQWHPNVKHGPSGHVGPALVGLITDIETGEPLSLHRTWLRPDGSGKAALEKPRLLLAAHRSNGVLRLWPDDEVTLGLVLGEGIESCLAAARGGLTPVWACLSARNLGAFPVLDGISGITILVDHDRPNPKTGRRAGIDAGRELIERYVSVGFDRRRDIQVIMSPSEGADAADLVVGG